MTSNEQLGVFKEHKPFYVPYIFQKQENMQKKFEFVMPNVLLKFHVFHYLFMLNSTDYL